MKKIILLPAGLLISTLIYAQIPEDALRYSYYPQNGTARSLAIGGAMGSLGGDISSIFVNPAGLGNYKTGEFVFTPGFFMNSNKTNFRDTKNKSSKNNFGLGPIGFVYGYSTSRTSSQAISLAFTQTANFNNSVQYNGLNNSTSYSQAWADEFFKSGQVIDDALNNPNFAYGTAPALYTYLVDTFRNTNGDLQVRSLPENILNANQALRQQNTVDTKGAQYEIALGYAMNKNDKFQFGFSVGIPIMHYHNITTYKESDTSSNKNNGFDSFTYTDDYTTSGAGVNLKVGVIYKPSEHIRLGLAVHTPTYMVSLKDVRSTKLSTNTEEYAGQREASSLLFTNNQPGESKYSMLTPWRAMVSGSYVFSSIEDVRKQKGFITADIEYVNHQGSNFYSANETPTPEETVYYKSLNQVIKDQYKGNFNFRLGGELKFNTIMGRLGFAYYTNPYKDKALVDANKQLAGGGTPGRMLISGGLGYRHLGFFIDLTYIYSINKDVNFPYRLDAPAENTFASVNDQRGNIVASIGFKF